MSTDWRRRRKYYKKGKTCVYKKIDAPWDYNIKWSNSDSQVYVIYSLSYMKTVCKTYRIKGKNEEKAM